jgi:2-polyprenyl-6-methoxyphenol hydroxylase-like FAD-dependent oxidoreductase
MTAKRSIMIVGGGLAGLTLGIGLRQRGVPVSVWEAGHYPRHRVCGEFISGRGQETLRRLGLLDKLASAGAIPARRAAFYSSRAAAPVRDLTEPAISISRHALDHLLAEEFRGLGGELRENVRWRGDKFEPGMVRASGRKPAKTAETNGWRWFGLKVHARGVRLEADMEMHLAPSSYVGMSWLKGGEVNICGLFRRPAGAGEAPLRWQEAFKGEEGSVRWRRLANAKFDEASFCSVAGLSLARQRAEAAEECSVGDSITMIPPVTGNGMSMAFESAEIATAPLASYSVGKLDWEAARKTVAQDCDRAFASRLVWAARLQRLMFAPGRVQDALVWLLPRSESLWRLLLGKTR